jgi:hypothetical protein
MSGSLKEFESLKRAFAAREQTPAALADCPETGLLFDAASGDLEPERRLQIVDHVARCAECAMAMRLAMELEARPAGEGAQQAISARARPGWMPSFALAASLMVTVGLTMFFFLPTHTPQPQYRQSADPLAASSLVGDRLARDRCLLRWSAGAPGSTYTLRVSTRELSPLLYKHDLAAAEFLVPSGLLAEVASGQQILWQVETRLPDSRRVMSETFVVTLD